MIIRCHHLREAGILKHDCCSHCHIHAGCPGYELPDGHRVVFCCALLAITPEQEEILRERIPAWEAQANNSAMSLPESEIPPAFRPAYQAVQHFEGDERCLAAIISGPVVWGDATENSVMYVQIIVQADVTNHHWNTLMVAGVRLDLTFRSYDQFHDRIYREIERQNRTTLLNIARNIIVFDKTGKVRFMQEGARQEQPHTFSLRGQQITREVIFRFRTQVENALETDPFVARSVMDAALTGFLISHYQLQKRWWVGGYRALQDLHHWDPDLARRVERYLGASELREKFECWLAISEYILRPLENCPQPALSLCSCEKCRAYLDLLSPLILS